MVMSIVIVMIVILIICSQWTRLHDNKEPVTTWLFFILLTLGTALAIALSFRIDVPSPVDFVTFIFQPISNALQALLHT
ncbi:hypothetical protein P9B03_17580 [Metasolibacillus meyeri]|uniref:Uncharacterized protein n=1 Tax=Metasolibacillus meyeri TaxID=1071052 RepID=A0AAW9NZ85_9BACL|nr:hypothetical protein [Metasolibacillus meyeri]MEC1180308.1 hypothetical protein [Metasolibacillus meyeri]